MNKETIEALAREAAKNIKSEGDLNEFQQILTKVTVERALNGELDDHLGYDKHEKSNNANSRNGSSRKTLRTEDESAMKIIYLAIRQASEKWTMFVINWKAALNRFMIMFEDRLKDYI